jgi:putative copper resistance protein D
MGYLVPLTEFGHYLMFSLLVGHVFLQFIPETKKPHNLIPKQILLMCTLGIMVFTFIPVLQDILYFKNSVGIISSAVSVITDFEIGRTWLIICILSTILWITIYVRGSNFFQALLLLLMIFAIGIASHSTSISFWPGILSHTTHFLLVTIWGGILLNVAWFTMDRNNWSSFLRWFTPVAGLCFIFIVITGFVMMFFVINKGQYVNSWAVPYGRMLLIKHISIVPLLAFALINGFLSRKILRLDEFDPRVWLKAESLFLTIVFFCTGVMGTLSPPHEVDYTIHASASSTWFNWIFAQVPIQVEFGPSVASVILMFISILFLTLIIVSFKMMTPAFAMIFGSCFIIVVYFGLIFSVHNRIEEGISFLVQGIFQA